MAAVNLPDNPANGTTQTVGGITYTYNSSKGYWTAASSGGGGGGGASVTTSDSAPSSPSDGDLWYDTDDGGMFVYYADGTSNQWVEVIGTQGAQGTLTTSDSAPSSPSDGDLWYDTDDGGLFIYYADGTSSQWVEVVGQQGAQGPAGPAGATTIVADTTALLAISSPSAGDMAYVSGNNTLYFYNGSGWYKIALINTTPSISGANASYTLATDGTATTVTLVASDPEGLPITYSIASDTSGNIATVTQGTGSSTNVFTITPSTNNAHAGTFSLTFRASDGVNFATAASSFTLTFVVQNSNYTTALITTAGNAGTNTTFTDSSSNSHTVTANGDATQDSFSPYRHGGYSTYFDGSGDYLKVTDSAEHDFGTGDFSMEFFWWPETVTGNSGNIHIMISAPNNSHQQFIYHESNYWYWQTGGGGATIIPSSTGAVTARAWNHVVLCRSGTTVSIFNNGTRTATVQSSQSADFSNATIGRYDSGGYEIDGYVRDMRWLKGSSAYDATQTSITVPTEPLTAITNTTLLTCHLPYIADGSTTGHSIAVNGDTHTRPFAPYDTGEYSVGSHGGSISLDGTGDFLSAADHADFEFGSGDFTMEAWIYLTGYSNSYGGYYAGGIMGKDSSGNRSFTFSVQATSNSYTGLQLYLFNGGTATSTIGTASMGLNQWYHVAATRASGTVKLFLNGKQIQSGTNSTNIDNLSAPFVVGASSSFSNYEYRLKGNISDARVVKGTAVYTAEFTPPTTPLTAITNTSLLLNMQGAKIFDKAQGSARKLTLAGNTTASTAAYKYLPTSMYFDGTGDYIQLEGMDDRYYGDFTVEMWVKFNTYNSGSGVANSRIFASRQGGNHPDNLQLIIDYTGTNGSIDVWTNTYHITDGTTNIADNNWHHIAVSRQGTSMKLFIDGTQEGSTATTSQSFLFWDTRLGTRDASTDTVSKYTGYMSDVRITKGLARYTSNFTAPTAALQG